MKMCPRGGGIVISLVLSVAPAEASVITTSPATIWNTYSRFRLATYHTGKLSNVCFIKAPWGPYSWGIEASTFSDPRNHRLEAAQFSRRPTGVASLAGMDSNSRWGFVRYVQGDIWGRSHCGAIPWRVPPPLRTSGRRPVIKLDYRRDGGRLLTRNDSWLMPAVNVWFSSPAFPPGGDKAGRKPLVMDLAFGYQCNIPGCKLGSFEDEYAFHYQRFIPYVRYGDRARCGGRPAWRCYTIPLSGMIRDALRHDWRPSGPLAGAGRSLRLYQLDVLIEFYNSRGAASIDNVRVERAQIDSTLLASAGDLGPRSGHEAMASPS
jgi:hypothetical protein